MPDALIPKNIQCPYCWQSIEIIIDASVPQQSYIEDCQVCCRPIVFDIDIDANEQLTMTVKSEDD